MKRKKPIPTNAENVTVVCLSTKYGLDTGATEKASKARLDERLKALNMKALEPPLFAYEERTSGVGVYEAAATVRAVPLVKP